jgi:hypothetical protein
VVCKEEIGNVGQKGVEQRKEKEKKKGGRIEKVRRKNWNKRGIDKLKLWIKGEKN